MKGSVVFQKRERRGVRISDAPKPETSWRIATVAGFALALVGWTDAFLLWFPANFGNTEWEFATTSTFFDAVPLGTIGLLAFTAGILNREGRALRWCLALVLPLLIVFLLGSAGLFALAAMETWGNVVPAYKPVLERILVKTSILSVTYVALYTWLAWTLALSTKKR